MSVAKKSEPIRRTSESEFTPLFVNTERERACPLATRPAHRQMRRPERPVKYMGRVKIVIRNSFSFLGSHRIATLLMNSLPDELLVHVIGVGDAKTAVKLGAASRRSRSLAHGDEVKADDCSV